MKTEGELRAELYERLSDLSPLRENERKMIENWNFQKQRQHLVYLSETFSLQELQETIKEVERYGYTNLELSIDDLSIYAILDKYHDDEINPAADSIREYISRTRPLSHHLF